MSERENGTDPGVQVLICTKFAVLCFEIYPERTKERKGASHAMLAMLSILTQVSSAWENEMKENDESEREGREALGQQGPPRYINRLCLDGLVEIDYRFLD